MIKTYNVSFLNEKKIIKVKENERILNVAFRNKIFLPVGCRYGICITCAAQLIKGKVSQIEAKALNRKQIKDGYILLCVSKPKSDCLINEGVKSQDSLYINPFKGKKLQYDN